MTKPFRVLVGTDEIVRQVYELGEGFRALGHDVTTVVAAENAFYPDAAYDVVLEPRSDLRIPSWRRPVDRRLGQLHGLARLPADAMRHDVFVFQFGQTLLPGGRDLPILRRAGKTVISCFLGSDIRHWSATEQFRRSVKLGTYPGYREGRSIDRALESLRMAELYSTVSFFQPSYAELAVLPYQHLYLARICAGTSSTSLVARFPSSCTLLQRDR